MFIISIVLFLLVWSKKCMTFVSMTFNDNTYAIILCKQLASWSLSKGFEFNHWTLITVTVGLNLALGITRPFYNLFVNSLLK